MCFQKLFWVALDVCVGKNQLGGDKRDKIANIGAVECRTCHRKLSTKRLSTKKNCHEKIKYLVLFIETSFCGEEGF